MDLGARHAADKEPKFMIGPRGQWVPPLTSRKMTAIQMATMVNPSGAV
jgi:hypothetical protein